MSKQSLFNCFCESRKILNFYAKKLEEGNFNMEEKELLYEIIEYSQITSNKIKQFCEKNERTIYNNE